MSAKPLATLFAASLAAAVTSTTPAQAFVPLDPALAPESAPAPGVEPVYYGGRGYRSHGYRSHGYRSHGYHSHRYHGGYHGWRPRAHYGYGWGYRPYRHYGGWGGYNCHWRWRDTAWGLRQVRVCW